MSRGGKTFRVPSDTESEASRYEDAFKTPDSPPSDTDPLSYSALLFEPRPESLTLFTTLLSDTLSHNPQDNMAPEGSKSTNPMMGNGAKKIRINTPTEF